MSTTDLVRSWRVGHRTATMTVAEIGGGVHRALIEWDPEMPTDLTATERDDYHRGLFAALEAMGFVGSVEGNGKPQGKLDD